jgi:hypothetical protein
MNVGNVTNVPPVGYGIDEAATKAAAKAAAARRNHSLR